MKNQRKRLLALVAMVLACIMVLPVFGGCSKEEKAPTTTAEEAFKEEENTTVPSTTTKVPVATKSNPNAESLQSTPNKGGNKKVTSGTTSVKSKYSQQQEALLGGTTLNPTATPQERRDYAEAYMRAMQSNLWVLQDRPETQVSTSSGEKTYYLHDYADEAAWRKAFGTAALKTPDNYDYKVATEKTYSFELRSGITYRGLPYSRAAAGLENFNLFVKERNEQGVALVDTRFDTYYLYGAPGIIGNIPATALAYAWNTVSYTTYTGDSASTFVPQNGYCYVEGLKFPEMDKEDVEALQKPLIPDPDGKHVGSIILKKLSPILEDASLNNDTDDIVAFNGEQGMYAVYANMQKADGLVREDNTTNECKMVVTVNVVKNQDGSINGDESYVTVLAQTNALTELKDAEGNPVLDANGKQIMTFSEVDAKYTFKQLFEGNYIAVTVPELLYESADDGGASVRDPNEAYAARKTASYLYTGVLGASRRVLWCNAVLTDEAGNEVFNNICFAERGDVKTYTKGATTEPGRYIFDMAKFDDSQEKIVSLGTDVVAGSSLKPGKYHYKITARMITGEELVAREFDFTVAEK